jgi:triosephosphate isomerase
MRKALVAGNWKMHGGFAANAQLLGSLQEILKQSEQFAPEKADVVVCPVSVHLQDSARLLRDKQTSDSQASENQGIKLGAQNCSQFEQGAYTGEVSLRMLEEVACDYVILGHSERREYFGETNQQVAEKFQACESSSVTPILCVGETLNDRQSGNTEAVITEQITAVIKQAGISAFNNAVIAYEPVWAIGTGETATPEQAQAVHSFVRALLAQHDAQIADRIQILYGGSVKPENASELFSQLDIDGGLIGGASLNADDFADICIAACQ